MSPSPHPHPDEVRELLALVCQRRELLILVTPFLRYESNFVALMESELHILATMSREDALYGLRTPDLRLRFPRDLGFVEASVQFLGLGLHENRHTVRLSIPKTLKESDQRVAYRVERVGRVDITLTTPKNDLLSAALVDISISGARLHLRQDLPPDSFQPEDRILLSIPLAEGLRIETPARVRHFRGRSLGVQYAAPLPPPVLDPLSRWVFLRREEERERLAARLEPKASPSPAPIQESLPEGALLLVSADPDLEHGLRNALEAVRPLQRIPPTTQALREAMRFKPSLCILHLPDLGLDARRHGRTLMEVTGRKVPALLLGTDIDGANLFEVAGEWKATSAMAWNPSRALFLRRLVQGILRRHEKGGDSPLAPQEPED